MTEGWTVPFDETPDLNREQETQRMLNISLSNLELQALLCIPSFQNPSHLSPFRELASQRPAQPPEEGLNLLIKKKLWDPQTQELTAKGQKRLIPLFLTQYHICISATGDSSPPQHFYGYRSVIVQNVGREDGTQVLSPILSDKMLMQGLKRQLSNRNPPITENNLTLFHHEFATLYELKNLEEQGQTATAQTLHNAVEQRWSVEGRYPILGDFKQHPHLHEQLSVEGIQHTLQLLLNDQLIQPSASGSYVTGQAVGELFARLLVSPELRMLREEIEDQHLLSREASILEGQKGYFLGRSFFHEQLNAPMVQMEDIEWYQLFTLLNEIVRPKEYIPQLKLSANSLWLQQIRA